LRQADSEHTFGARELATSRTLVSAASAASFNLRMIPAGTLSCPIRERTSWKGEMAEYRRQIEEDADIP